MGLAWLYDVVTGQISLELLHSHDGIDWRREATREPWVADGQPHGLNGNMYIPLSTPPLIVGDEMWFYISAANRTHHQPVDGSGGPSRIHLFALSRDRWVSYGSRADREGMLLSAPFVWRGGRMFLNASIETGGTIIVEFCDQAGNALRACDLDRINPITGPADGVEIPVSYWGEYDKRVLSMPLAAPVRVKFTLRRARLYGWSLRL